MAKKSLEQKSVETLTHENVKRKNIPTAEYQSVMKNEDIAPLPLKYPRNTDLDPQLVWRGKDQQDLNDLIVNAPPLYIQEKIHPKSLIDDLLRQTKENQPEPEKSLDLFSDFNGIPQNVDKTDFYQHNQNWTNRMILGDSFQVMASLAERESLRGKVQCIYFDPPYGIKFNSNFQWSSTSRDVKDGNRDHITREPEQVKAFRDTWRDGIHSYLTYLRDRLTAARDLLTDSGSIFVQIGDENVHLVRVLMDEVFGVNNFVRLIIFSKTGSMVSNELGRTSDFIIWYAKIKSSLKYRQLYFRKTPDDFYNQVELSSGHIRKILRTEILDSSLLPTDSRIFRLVSLESSGSTKEDTPFEYVGKIFRPNKNSHWKLSYPEGMEKLKKSGRITQDGATIRWKYYVDDYPLKVISEVWTDTSGFSSDQQYVVETRPKVIERCLLMTTDPGDLVLDPTCGSGTTAYVAEQWGRRWITIDTSRVALILARTRLMGARYPFYLLADSIEGQAKEAQITKTIPKTTPTFGNIRHGFVYERVPHITLKSIANNEDIDVIWKKWQETLEPLREKINSLLKKNWQEWDIPRESDKQWTEIIKQNHAAWWEARLSRQKEIDASIAAKAEFEYLYDKPYEDKKKVRVAGPFTVESLSPYRMLGIDENEELIDPLNKKSKQASGDKHAFQKMILENLKTAGVQQIHKDERINFNSLTLWAGDLINAEGLYQEGENEKRAAIFIGDEFGTVSRTDLAKAAREAADAGFDVMIACAFNYEALATDFNKMGRLPVLKARINADLQMAENLKNTGKGNLFVIFGEPDIVILPVDSDRIQVKIKGLDLFDPKIGNVRSDNLDGIACWFIDTNYNEEEFFVRQAYFLGANDPYQSLKTTLKAEINPEVWSQLNSNTSIPFKKPSSGRIAVKAINHLGDEVMKVFKVS